MATQYGECGPILRYFEGHVGRFLDVGAGDGVTFSNTEPLLRTGWSGLMIEPAISQLRWLIENHGDNPKVEIITAALVPLPLATPGLVCIHDSRDFSTLRQTHRKLIEAHDSTIKFRERRCPLITWNHLLGIFDFINIDVEGMNLITLQELPFAMLNPQMVCIEIDPEDALPLMTDILARAGLTHTLRVGGNLLAARREII